MVTTPLKSMSLPFIHVTVKADMTNQTSIHLKQGNILNQNNGRNNAAAHNRAQCRQAERTLLHANAIQIKVPLCGATFVLLLLQTFLTSRRRSDIFKKPATAGNAPGGSAPSVSTNY